MPSTNDEHVYEYAVLRYVPDIEREEFINVGLAMVCKRLKWLRLEVNLDIERLELFRRQPITRECLEHQLEAFRKIAAGSRDAGPIAEYPVEERFRWLTAEKSACLRASAVHPGLTTDPDCTFDSLFSALVL